MLIKKAHLEGTNIIWNLYNLLVEVRESHLIRFSVHNSPITPLAQLINTGRRLDNYFARLGSSNPMT